MHSQDAYQGWHCSASHLVYAWRARSGILADKTHSYRWVKGDALPTRSRRREKGKDQRQPRARRQASVSALIVSPGFSMLMSRRCVQRTTAVTSGRQTDRHRRKHQTMDWDTKTMPNSSQTSPPSTAYPLTSSND